MHSKYSGFYLSVLFRCSQGVKNMASVLQLTVSSRMWPYIVFDSFLSEFVNLLTFNSYRRSFQTTRHAEAQEYRESIQGFDGFELSTPSFPNDDINFLIAAKIF